MCILSNCQKNHIKLYRPRLLHPHHFLLLSSHFSAILPAAFLPFSSHQNDGFPSFFFQFGQAEILGGLMPRPPHFRCFLSFAACGFIHFIQNAKIASANSEKFFPKKRQNYQPFSEIIPFVQSGSLLLLATCSSFFPPSPAAIVCLVKVLSYFIKREVLGLLCGESAAHPRGPTSRGHLRGGQALLCAPPLYGRSAPYPGLLSRVEESSSINAAKDTPGTRRSLAPRHKGADPLGFPRPLPLRYWL